jgi:hypothetical protein
VQQKIVRTPLTRQGFGDILENWDLTHKEMATLLGTTSRTVSRYLSGEAPIPPATQHLLLLAEAMPIVAAGLAAISQGKPVEVTGVYMPMKKILKGHAAR